MYKYFLYKIYKKLAKDMIITTIIMPLLISFNAKSK